MSVIIKRTVDLENHSIIVNLNLIDSDKTVGMDWNSLKHWSIQLQGGN